MQISTFIQVFIFIYHVNYKKRRKIYYDEKEENLKFKNVMIHVFFNDNNEFKYDLVLYICKYYFDFKFYSFNNFEKFRDYALKYHDYDIRFAKFKHKLQNEKYIRYTRKIVYNYS